MGKDLAHNLPNGKSSSFTASRRIKRRSTPGESRGLIAVADNNNNNNNIKAKEKEMAASFLQYCAMCEKQIMTPCNSILYCSEACRRKDSVKPLSASNLAASMPSSMPSSPRPSLSARVASASPDLHDTPSYRISSELHDHKSDLDPTEWKPKIPRGGASSTSEAFRYLSRFHQRNNLIFSEHADGHQPIKLDRPAGPRHKSTMSMTTLTTSTPSLGNTPTTTASSFESMYDFNLRPLPARTNPLYSSSAGASRGIDLVTPHIPPPAAPVDVTVAGSADTELDFWGKKKVIPVGASPNGMGEGLGALFSKDNAI